MKQTKLNRFFNQGLPGNNPANNLSPQDGTRIDNQALGEQMVRDATKGNKGKNFDPKTIIKQINLMKKQSACTTYFKELGSYDIMLAQEPYVVKNSLRGVPRTHKGFLPYHKDKPRVAILLPKELAANSFTMGGFSNRDMLTIKCNTTNKNGALLCSIYMYHDSGKPKIDPDVVHKLQTLTEYANNNNIPLYIAIDSNGHHTTWNSHKTTDRGNRVAQLINQTSLIIANKGSKPTFINTRGFKSI